MSKKTTRESRKQKRGLQPKPLPQEPNAWNIGARCLDANNAAHVTLNGYEIFQCVFKPEEFIEAIVRQRLNLEILSEEETADFLAQLKKEGYESPSPEEAHQLGYRMMEEGMREEAQSAADFISSRFGELCNLMMSAAIATAKIDVRQRRRSQGGAPPINAEKARAEILFAIWPFIRGLLGISGPGGDKRSGHSLKEGEDVLRQRIDELTPLWNYIVAYQAKYGDWNGWYRDMMEEQGYQERSSVCPSLTLKFILDLLHQESKPSLLAHLHALSEQNTNGEN